MRGPGTYADGARGAHAAPADAQVAPNPLDHLAEEHMRQREICGLLDTLAASLRPDPALARPVLEHLTVFLPRHIRDEEQDLFPVLRRRSDPDDEIRETLDRLIEDHVQSGETVGRVVGTLQRVLAGNTPLRPGAAAELVAFAAHERRHLVVENAIVLPLARVRLTAQDLRDMRARMIARRAADASENGPEAD